MKRILSAKNLLLVAGLSVLAHSAGAQTTTTMTPSSRSSRSAYGMLGEQYSGLSYAYTDIDDGPPNGMHTAGFVANRPTSQRMDAMFKYDYSRSTSPGPRNRQHAVVAGVTAYVPFNGFTPFIEGNAGWIFQKGDLGRKDSFMYLAAAGAEIQVASRFVLTPYVSYQEAPHFDTRGWNYGVKAAYRLAREWSLAVGFQIDENENAEYRFGVNRHF